MVTIPPPAPVPCEGCGELTPYDVGESSSYGEWLATPLGVTYARTHRLRECVVASRAKHEGRRIAEPMTKAERDALAMAAQS